MLVQVVSAPVADRDPLLERLAVAAAGVDGLAGFIAGVSGDGTFVGVARFDGPTAVPWWASLEPWLGGPVEVRESSDVEVVLGGGPDEAGYLEVIQGQTADRARFMALERQLERSFGAERPDFLGSRILWWPDGSWIEVAGFTSEADVRAGDARALPPDVEALVAAWEEVARPSSQVELVDPLVLSPPGVTVEVVAGCLFETSLPAGDWRWTSAGAALTLLHQGVRNGRLHLRFRAEAPGRVRLRFEAEDAVQGVSVRVAPERFTP